MNRHKEQAMIAFTVVAMILAVTAHLSAPSSDACDLITQSVQKADYMQPQDKGMLVEMHCGDKAKDIINSDLEMFGRSRPIR